MSTTERELVLRYPDLAARLTEPPFDYDRPQQWNGFVPPATQCTGAINPSPRRKALLELVHEARNREQQETWTT